ncbi:MAG: hypothetical protein PHT79_03315 [Syntrophomonadaceae bacterium]|nr:hypothetical protein [Syntrophomonadaceae bacterium]MDD3889519.1 hypothetical protein [Syntrophomonadaceae bacterium]MDD4548771.1 hypothetical protein [Syntrophomonadaceae bacterium]
MKLSTREIFLLVILIIIATGYAFHTYTYVPLREEIDKLILENSGLEKTIKAEEETINAFMQLDEEKQNHDYKLLAAKVPEAPFLPEMIAYLNKSARDADINLLAVHYKELSRENIKQKGNNAGGVHDPWCLELQATVSGSYPGLILFLNKIEKADRIYALENTKIKLSKRKTENFQSGILEEGEIPHKLVLPATTITVGYNPDHILMDVKFKAYYDNRNIKGISGIDEQVEPGQGVDNPFKR